MNQLRKKAKELGIKRYTVLKRIDLEKSIEEIELLRQKGKELGIKELNNDDLKKAIKKIENYHSVIETIECQNCLQERDKQKQIDKHDYHKKMLANIFRREHFKAFSERGDILLNYKTGEVLPVIEINNNW